MEKYKPNLEAFKNRPDQIFVLDRFNYIEKILTQIIAKYIEPSPSRKRFTELILLNNSIVSFGSKIKLFFHMNAIENWIDIDKNKFHRLLQIRNQFTHSGTQCLLPREKGKPECNVKLILESVSSAGLLVEVDSETALNEFTQLCAEIREKLHIILEKQQMADNAR